MSIPYQCEKSATGLEGNSNSSSVLPKNFTEFMRLFRELPADWQQEAVKSAGKSSTDEFIFWARTHYEKPSIESFIERKIAYELMDYLPLVLVIIGLFGNMGTLVVLCQRAMRKVSTYFYLAVLAIADTFVLFIGLLTGWIGHIGRHQNAAHIRDQSEWACKLMMFFHSVATHFSAWLIVSVTVERYIAVCHPLKASEMCHIKRAKYVVVALLVLIVLVDLHFLWTVGLICGLCNIISPKLSVIWPWMDTVIYSFLPFTTITVLNSMIILTVAKARRFRANMQGASMSQSSRDGRHQESNVKLTIMLLTVSFAFLITTLPFGIMTTVGQVYNKHYKATPHKSAQLKLVEVVAKLLMYTNHSINFFLYCATGNKFRRQLKKLFCKPDPKTFRFPTSHTTQKESVSLLSNSKHRQQSSISKMDTLELKDLDDPKG